MNTEQLTGNISLRKTRSFLGNEKMVLQVEVIRDNPAPEFSGDHKYIYWIDATPEHLENIPKEAFSNVLVQAN